MSVSAVPADRGRNRESPSRTDHFLPRHYPSRDHSPYLVTDRITRYRSPSRDRDSDKENCEVPSRIEQPYRTSFSAVTALSPSARKTSPLAHTGYSVGTFPRRGVRSTLPGKVRNGNSPSSQRSGSHDLLSSASKTGQPGDEPDDLSATERSASCDLLDSPAHAFTPMSDKSIHGTRASPFDNRRLNPKYSSTPTRFHMNMKSPVVKSIQSNRERDKDSRLDSNISSNTIDSVFLPDSPHHDATHHSAISSEDPSCEISKPPDSGFVEGRVERRWLVEREYGTCLVLGHAELKKMKKKGLLPEPNEETARLVQEMKQTMRQNRSGHQSAPCTPHSEEDGHLGRSRWRSTLNKKAHSITNFLRRLQSPKTNQNTDKRNRRSKSAGRLEGNRVFGSGSNSSLGGIYESSYEVPSTSSDQSSSAFQTSTPSEPIRSSDTDLNQPIESGSSKVQVLVTNSPSEGAKQNKASSSQRRILKSLEDCTGADKSVYRSFKQKQSPGYRMQSEAISMRTQALKAVEIPMQPASKQSGSGTKYCESGCGTGESGCGPGESGCGPCESGCGPGESGCGPCESGCGPGESGCEPGGSGCAGSDSYRLLRVATSDTIGNCSLDVYNIGSENSSRNEGVFKSADASRISLNSKDQSLSPIKSHDVSNTTGSEHLQNGDAAIYEQPKTPSYIKLSCAISGYKQYGNQQNTTVSLNPAKENGIEIALDNNNSVLQNGEVHGEPVTLEYTPSKNAYVRKVSERFEQFSKLETTNSSNNNGGGISRTAKSSESIPQQYNGASFNLVSTNLPGTHSSTVQQHTVEKHSTASNALRESRTGWRSNTSESKALSISTSTPNEASDNVDSENINFSQAKLAFVHENTSAASQGSSHQVAKRSVLDKSSVKSHKLVIPAEHVITHASHITVDTDVDSRANGVQDISSRDCDVTDHASHVVTSQQLDIVTNSISSSKPPAEPFENGGEHLMKSVTQSDNAETGAPQCNGGVVNGLEPVTEVARLSNHSSFDSLDTPTPSKDGTYFLNCMALEAERIQALVNTAESDLQSADMPEEVSGKVRAAVGKGNLLTSKKFKQFRGLCERNMTQSAEEDFQTTCQDLAGFWDMVLIQVHDVYHLFDEVQKLRQNDWKIASNKSSPVLSKPQTPKTPGGKRSARSSATPKSAKAAEAAKAREEARKKLLQAKKAGRRQRKTSENDGIEVEIVT